MAVTVQFTAALLMLTLLAITGSHAVNVDRIGIYNFKELISAKKDEHPAPILGCWYSFSGGEVGEAVVWTRDDVQVKSDAPPGTTSSSGLFVNTLDVTTVHGSKEESVYSCIVRTTNGNSDTDQMSFTYIGSKTGGGNTILPHATLMATAVLWLLRR